MTQLTALSTRLSMLWLANIHLCHCLHNTWLWLMAITTVGFSSLYSRAIWSRSIDCNGFSSDSNWCHRSESSSVFDNLALWMLFIQHLEQLVENTEMDFFFVLEHWSCMEMCHFPLHGNVEMSTIFLKEKHWILNVVLQAKLFNLDLIRKSPF